MTSSHATSSDLLLFDDGDVRIFYAPFDSTNTSASVVLVGITPGRRQALLAWLAVQEALRGSDDERLVLSSAKKTAAFAGGMRTNLVSMLDEIGVGTALDIDTTGSLFEEKASLLHSTSAILYPAFVGPANANYGGGRPKMLRHPTLRGFVEEVLAADLALVPNALVVPLGAAVAGALSHLTELGELDERRCLLGLPHPSPANGHRIPQFSERKQELASSVRQWARQLRA